MRSIVLSIVTFSTIFLSQPLLAIECIATGNSAQFFNMLIDGLGSDEIEAKHAVTLEFARFKMKQAEGKIGAVQKMFATSDYTIVGTKTGTFFLENSNLVKGKTFVKIEGLTNTRWEKASQLPDGALFLSSSIGSVRVEGRKITFIKGRVGQVKGVRTTNDDRVMIIAHNGLFHLNGDEATLIPGTGITEGGDDEYTWNYQTSTGQIFLQKGPHLYYLDGRELKQVENSDFGDVRGGFKELSSGEILAFPDLNSSGYILETLHLKGLYRIENGRARPFDTFTGEVKWVQETSTGKVFVGAHHGLFRLSEQELLPVLFSFYGQRPVLPLTPWLLGLVETSSGIIVSTLLPRPPSDTLLWEPPIGGKAWFRLIDDDVLPIEGGNGNLEHAVVLDGGDLLVASDHGLFHISGQKAQPILFFEEAQPGSQLLKTTWGEVLFSRAGEGMYRIADLKARRVSDNIDIMAIRELQNGTILVSTWSGLRAFFSVPVKDAKVEINVIPDQTLKHPPIVISWRVDHPCVLTKPIIKRVEILRDNQLLNPMPEVLIDDRFATLDNPIFTARINTLKRNGKYTVRLVGSDTNNERVVLGQEEFTVGKVEHALEEALVFQKQDGTFRAVVAGVTHYNGNLRSYPPLDLGAAAKLMQSAIYDLAVARGFEPDKIEIKLLIGGENQRDEPTREKFLSAIHSFATVSLKGDTLAVYFTGHGAQDYLYGSGADTGDIFRRINVLSELMQVISNSNASTNLVFLDTCRISDESSALSDDTFSGYAKPQEGNAWFYSASHGQKSYIDKQEKYGIYTRYLSAALGSQDADGWSERGPTNKKDGVVTAAELNAFMKRKVQAYVTTHVSAYIEQDPRISVPGEFALYAYDQSEKKNP